MSSLESKNGGWLFLESTVENLLEACPASRVLTRLELLDNGIEGSRLRAVKGFHMVGDEVGTRPTFKTLAA
jgi:hypothetical protein